MKNPFALHLRMRLFAGLIVAVLAATSVVILSSPQVRRAVAGPDPQLVALQAKDASIIDLREQVEDLSAQVDEPRPVRTDTTQLARANDLKAQLDAKQAELDAALGQRAHLQTQANTQLARANDLKAQLDAAEDKLARPRPVPTVTVTAPAPAAPAPAAPAPAEEPPPAPVSPALTKQQILQRDDLFGLYTTESPFNNREFDHLETLVDRQADVTGYFQSWATPFRADVVQAAWARGEIPLLTWESQLQLGQTTTDQPEFTNAAIVSGRYDDYIRDYARAIAANGQALVLRFNHEMNGDWYPWGEGTKWNPETGERDILTNGNERGSFVPMWRHVHDIFEAEGANRHVVWLWAPNRVDRLTGSNASLNSTQRVYPGDEYVDWMGMSGYFRSGYAPETDFGTVFDATLEQLRQVSDKPIFLAEVGVAEATGQKVRYLQDFFAQVGQEEQVIGFSYFSQNVTATGNDWRIDSSPTAIDAFRTGIAGTDFGS